MDERRRAQQSRMQIFLTFTEGARFREVSWATLGAASSLQWKKGRLEALHHNLTS